MAGTTRAGWGKVANLVAALQRSAWLVGFLLFRTHYFLTVILGTVFGWR
jgi:hypothetical protein